METVFEFVHVGEGAPEAVVKTRQGRDIWSVPDRAVAEEVIWHTTREGGFVRVPLFRYVTEGRQPEVAMAYAFELGARAVLQAAAKPHKLYLVFGSPVADLYAAGGLDALAFWVGIALIYRSHSRGR